MSDEQLLALRQAGILDQAKCDEIAAFLKARATPVTDHQAIPAPRFDLTHVLWYAGALIITAAMGIFTTDAFNRLGGLALTACGLVYAVVLGVLGNHLWFKRDLRIPGGLLMAAAIAMVPMIIYGVQDMLGLWKNPDVDPGNYQRFFEYINGSWVYMELGTLVAALLAITRYRFPFILLIAAVALWFMSMDLAMWFTKAPKDFDDWETRRTISVLFGLVMIVCAWAWDVVKGRVPDMMFWIHIFGIMTFWGALSLYDGSNELQKFIYCLINVGLIGFSLFIDRRIYAVFGGIGIATYLSYLSYSVFKDWLGFSFALSAIGLAIIFAGLWLNKHKADLSAKLSGALPVPLRRLRPSDAA